MEFELAQESVERVESEYNTSENMKLLCKKLVSEGCVMLENDGTLPVGNKKIALFGRCQINTFYAGYGSGGDVKSPYKISILDGLINHIPLEEAMATHSRILAWRIPWTVELGGLQFIASHRDGHN